MAKFYYQNYTAVFTPDYILSDLIEECELQDAELVQMFQEDKELGYPNTDDTDMYYRYQLVFKIPIPNAT